MTLDVLDREIENKFKSFSYIEEKKAYEFIKTYLDYHKEHSIIGFLESDTWEFLKCYYYVRADNMTIENCSRVMDSCRSLFSILDDKSTENIMGIFGGIINCNEIDTLISYFNEDTIADRVYLNSLSKIDNRLIKELSTLKRELKQRKIDIIPFLEGYSENIELMSEMIAFSTIKREIEERYEKTLIVMDGKGLTEKEIEHKKNRIVSEFLSRDYRIDNIDKMIQLVADFVKDYERREKKNTREKIAISDARDSLEKEMNNKMIYNYREITKGIKDPKIKYMFLKIIKDHNQEYYEQLEDEYDLLQQGEETYVIDLLNSYGIKNGSYKIESIIRFSKIELEEILKFLSLLNITSEDKVSILQNSSIEIVRYIKGCFENKILSSSFISNNIDIFNISFERLNTLKENVLYLKENNIPLSFFINSCGVLLSDSNMFKENVETLSTYNLLTSFKSEIDYSFLLKGNLNKKIDKLLEHGFEEYLEDDISLLNSDNLYRLDIIKLLKIPINSSEELHSLLDNNKEFFISYEEALSYLPNMEEYANFYEIDLSLNDLEKYRISDRLYDINGIKISYNKVIREINNGNSVFNAIISNTFLEEREMELLSEIKNKALKKEK